MNKTEFIAAVADAADLSKKDTEKAVKAFTDVITKAHPFKILRSVDPLLDEEALRVVKGMPKWIPGKLGKEIVSMRITLPIPFMLHQKKK